jgi:ribose 5-phosphate isomerase B
MKIPIASDHAGYPAKEFVKTVLQDLGHDSIDLGTHSEESVDYPDYGAKVASAVGQEQYPLGILLCGSGQGMCMTANKFDGVRAALAYDESVAQLSRQHNNANVLCLPGRTLSHEQLREIVTQWITTDFEGGRHERRVEKIESSKTTY